MQDVVQTLTVAKLRDAMKAAGFRTEVIADLVTGPPFLRSAASGLNFDVRFANKAFGDEEGYLDVTFAMFLKVVGDLPLILVNKWNGAHRFARLLIDDRFSGESHLVFCMDIVAIGSMTDEGLRAHLDIWDGLLREFVAWLRTGPATQLITGGMTRPQALTPSMAPIVKDYMRRPKNEMAGTKVLATPMPPAKMITRTWRRRRC